MTARDVIRKHLAALQDDLEQFEMTTHGVITNPDFPIMDVAVSLVQCYRHGGSYNTSSLWQSLRALRESPC